MEQNKIGYKDILRQKEFMKTVVADIINRFGDSIDSIAFVWLVYQVTHSAAWSAIIFGVNRIPTVFLQPLAGAAIEGRNKKKIMVVTDMIRGVCVGFIATALLLGFVNRWLLITATVIISCAEAFRGPASAALIPKLLDEKYYDFGLPLSRSAASIMELIGLGAAGIIIAAFSVSAAVYIDMATFFISAAILYTLRIKETVPEKMKFSAGEYMETLKSGFTYLKNNRLIRYFVILAVFLNAILVPYNSLQAPLISEVLHTGEIMLSILGISISVGMIAGAAVFPYIKRKLSSRAVVILSGYSIAVFYFSFVIVGKFIASAALIYVIMALVSFYLGIAVALLSCLFSVEFTKNIKAEYMARCSAISGALCVAATPVVSFIISAVAGLTTTAVLFIIAGASDVIICFYLCGRKRFRAMQDAELKEAVYEEAGDSQAGQSA